MYKTGLTLISLALMVSSVGCKDKAPPPAKEPAAQAAPPPRTLPASEYLALARGAASSDTSLALAWLRRLCEAEGDRTRWELLEAWGVLAGLTTFGRGARVLRKSGGQAGGQGTVSALAFSPSADLLAVGDEEGSVTLYRLDTLRQHGKLAPTPGSPAPVKVIAFSPDSATLAAASGQRVALWSLSSRGPHPREATLGAPAEVLVFSADSALLRAEGGGQVSVLSVASPSSAPDAGAPTWPPDRATAPPPPAWEVSTSGGGKVELKRAGLRWSLSLFDHGRPVELVAQSMDGRWAATADSPGTIKLWDLSMERQLVRWTELAGGKARAARLTDDGQRVLVLDRNGRLCVHHPDGSSRRCLPLKRYRGSLTQMGLTRDGRHLVIRAGSTARFWTVQSGKSRAARLEPDEVVSLSPDGGHMTSATFDGELVLRSTATGQELARSATRHKGTRANNVYGITYSPRGNRLATVRSGGTVQLWKAASLTPQGAVMMTGIQAPDLPVFTPDDAQLVIGERNGRVAFWDAHKGELIQRVPRAHDGQVTALAFAAESPLMATAGKDGKIRLWDRTTRKPRGPSLDIPLQHCQDLAFSPGDKHLVCVAATGRVATWDLHAATREAMTKFIDSQTNLYVDDAGKVSVR